MMNDLVFELDSTTSALKITLGDLLVFINWMQQADKALESGERPPDAPEVDSGQVLGWVTLVQKLDDRFNRCKEKQLALEANLVLQEEQLGVGAEGAGGAPTGRGRSSLLSRWMDSPSWGWMDQVGLGDSLPGP